MPAPPPPAEPVLLTPFVTVGASIVFFSYLRLELFVWSGEIAAEPGRPRIRLTQQTGAPPQQVSCRTAEDGSGCAITLEAMIDRACFPEGCALDIAAGACRVHLALPELLARGFAGQSRSLQPAFKQHIVEAEAAAATPPRLLDLGGRNRSGADVEHRSDYPECAVTAFDIVADPGVDVVGDAHELSRYFAPATFDFVLCVSVFEHLLMPWQVALEMNKVMKPGGVAFIHTHQTIGMHDVPWDFLRFSDTSWPGFFNEATGFDVLGTEVGHFQHIVPRAWTERYAGAEASGGWESSAVLVRKTGEPRLTWDVRLGEVIGTRYPEG